MNDLCAGRTLAAVGFSGFFEFSSGKINQNKQDYLAIIITVFMPLFCLLYCMVAVWGRCTIKTSILRAVYKALMKGFDSIGKKMCYPTAYVVYRLK